MPVYSNTDEIDELVAYKVMGETSFDYTSSWSPTSRFADAWSIIEKMKEKGWFFQLEYQHGEYVLYFAEENENGVVFNTYGAVAKDLKLAIIMAALRANGIEIIVSLESSPEEE